MYIARLMGQILVELCSAFTTDESVGDLFPLQEKIRSFQALDGTRNDSGFYHHTRDCAMKRKSDGAAFREAPPREILSAVDTLRTKEIYVTKGSGQIAALKVGNNWEGGSL